MTSYDQALRDIGDDPSDQPRQWSDVMQVAGALLGRAQARLMLASIVPDCISSRGEPKLLALIVEHFQRTIRLERKYEAVARRAAVKADALNQLAFGIVIINRV